jgi:hypothetical protein
VTKKPKHQRHEQDRRVIELQDQLKERDERIKDLRRELSEAEELISDMRERIEDGSALIDSWIEVFGMERDKDGKWTYAPWVDDCQEARDAYIALVKKWNRNVADFNSMIAPRNVGRPLDASEAQAQQVRKLRKAGRSLRGIAEDTNLGLQTVRTIIDKGDGRDRTTRKHLERIDPARFREEPWRKRTRANLSKRINETLERGAELVQAAKGLR